MSDVSRLFDRGLARNRRSLRGVAGERITDANALGVRLGLELVGDRIAEVSFRVTSCVTLLAFTELLAERITGRRLEDAARERSADLVLALRGVHPGKRDRAELPVRALMSAIARVLRDGANGVET